MARVTILAALAFAACAPSTVGPGGNLVVDGSTPDAASPDVASPDATRTDAAPLDQPSADAPTAPPDVPTTIDTPTAPPDVPTTVDVPTPPPDATASLRGTWRAVRYEFTSEGRTYTLTDRDTLVDTGGGMSTPFRVNGLMFLEATHLSVTFGALASGHFYTYTPTTPGDSGYTANGFGVPGLLDDARGEFAITGSPTPTRFARNADGTLSFVDAASGARTTYARTTSLGPALPNLNTAAIALIAEGFSPTATRPRAALLWDLRGDGQWLETNGAAVRFTGRIATFPVALAAPPAQATVAWMGSQAAVARLVAYDDVNNNLAYDRATDPLLGLSPVVITWRAPAPFTGPGAGHFPLRHVPDGFRFGHAHIDYAIGREDVVPYDHALPVGPGVPILRARPTGIPEIL